MGATADDIDPTAVTEYRRTRLTKSAEELKLKNQGLLLAIGAYVQQRTGNIAVTRTGLLLFGKQAALRRFCPSVRIDYILVAGPTWVPDTSQPLRSTEIRQALLLAIPRIAKLILQDLPTTFQLKNRGLRRKETPAIPERVIREAVVNAVMHRSYRMQEPVQIIRFSNRLEIRNPGHSLVSDEEFGEPGSRTRNERIAAVLHDCGYAETKGTGIKVMRDQMRSANMTQPIFRSSRQRDSFEVTLLTHHLLDASAVQWLASLQRFDLTDHDAKALVFARQSGYIDNAVYRNIVTVQGAVQIDPIGVPCEACRRRSGDAPRAHRSG
jgi:ATP-dependent DNA helicase RecG